MFTVFLIICIGLSVCLTINRMLRVRRLTAALKQLTLERQSGDWSKIAKYDKICEADLAGQLFRAKQRCAELEGEAAQPNKQADKAGHIIAKLS